MKKVLLILFTLLVGFTAISAQEKSKSVTITGLTGQLASYAQPSYGDDPENDAIEKYWVIIPDNGQSCDASLIDWFDEVKTGEIKLDSAMQLVIIGNKIKLEAGARYQITGTLMEWHTGHHHTPLLFFVDSAKKLRK